MKTFLKYFIRVLIISAIYHFSTIFDPTLETGFLLPGLREKIAYICYIIFGLSVWRIGENVFEYYNSKYFIKMSFNKSTPYLVLLFFLYGIFISFLFVACYYLLDVGITTETGSWPGPPFILWELNLGVFQYYLILMIPIGYQYYYKTLQKEKIINEQLKKENIQSKYEVLKNQIDPHFFFNSLSVLTTLVYKDADVSAEYITQLSKLYRYMLDKNNTSLVLLEKELKFLDSYIYLMKIRFKDRIDFKVDISEMSKAHTYIPPNTLQMLVENAIKHNKFSSENPLQISISEYKDKLLVSNNLNNKIIIGESNGIGLENIKLRYELLGGKTIQIHESVGTFSVKLPKFNQADYENIDI